METLGAHECDHLDGIATTVQHSKTAFRSDVQIKRTDRGRETRSNDVDEPVRGVKSAGRIERLLRNERQLQ